MFAKAQARGAATLVASPLDPTREAQGARAVLPHVRAGTAVLDLCCGAGWSTLLLTAHADKAATRCPVVAWDPDPQALSAAQEHISKAGFEERTRVLHSMPTGARFDLVYISHRAWAHSMAGGLFFREALACADNVLRKGGTIALVLPTSHAADGLRALQRSGYSAVLAGTDQPVLTPDDLGSSEADSVVIAHRTADRCGFPIQVHFDQRQLLCAFDMNRPGQVPTSEARHEGRQLLDAQVLCGLAASHPGPCLDLGTGAGHSAYQLASNIGNSVVTTVDMLPEQLAKQNATSNLTRDDIGRHAREQGAGNIRQLFANTQIWNWLDVPFGLHIASINASREEDGVLLDSLEAWRRLAIGGFLIWHDFSPATAATSPDARATINAVRKFLDRTKPYGKVHHLLGSHCGVLRKEESDA